MPRGYDRPLYIQPFDHLGSFQSGLFGFKPPLSNAQTADIAGAKQIIYDGLSSPPRRCSGASEDRAGGSRTAMPNTQDPPANARCATQAESVPAAPPCAVVWTR
jgi:hypothetical protein